MDTRWQAGPSPQPEFETVRATAAKTNSDTGRNDPCGSGRKFKKCCLGT
jgi:uncharacterized protein YecA (UPF0149 family)